MGWSHLCLSVTLARRSPTCRYLHVWRTVAWRCHMFLSRKSSMFTWQRPQWRWVHLAFPQQSRWKTLENQNLLIPCTVAWALWVQLWPRRPRSHQHLSLRQRIREKDSPTSHKSQKKPHHGTGEAAGSYCMSGDHSKPDDALCSSSESADESAVGDARLPPLHASGARSSASGLHSSASSASSSPPRKKCCCF